MTMTYSKIYHQSYSDSLSNLDPGVAQHIRSKEDIPAADPFSCPLNKGNLNRYRKFKSRRIRILFCLDQEHPDLWEVPPENREIMFCWAGLRNNNTYTKAYKCLSKFGLI